MRYKLHAIVFGTALVCCLTLLALPESEITALSQTGCSTPPTQGAATAWAQNATIHVGIDPSFSESEKQAILAQLGKWRNAGGANVTFVEKEPSALGAGACCGGNPILFITKPVPWGGGTAQGTTRGFAANGRRGDTFMDINPGVTDPTAFAHVVSHELGHTFGLADCLSDAGELKSLPALNVAALHLDYKES